MADHKVHSQIVAYHWLAFAKHLAWAEAIERLSHQTPDMADIKCGRSVSPGARICSGPMDPKE